MPIKTLADIPINSIEVLHSLAKLAPKKEPKNDTQAMGVSKKPSNTRSDMPELGRLNVESYLQAHGIAYNIKADGSKTFYRLNACLFDPNHHKNEAAIVQDSSGLLTYQCFHSSCRAYTWKDAREQISGDESLAKYCNGYDPNWRPPGKKKSKQKRLPPQPHPNRPYEHVTNLQDGLIQFRTPDRNFRLLNLDSFRTRFYPFLQS
jgi:hypothetical protein